LLAGQHYVESIIKIVRKLQALRGSLKFCNENAVEPEPV